MAPRQTSSVIGAANDSGWHCRLTFRLRAGAELALETDRAVDDELGQRSVFALEDPEGGAPPPGRISQPHMTQCDGPAVDSPGLVCSSVTRVGGPQAGREEVDG